MKFNVKALLFEIKSNSFAIRSVPKRNFFPRKTKFWWHLNVFKSELLSL